MTEEVSEARARNYFFKYYSTWNGGHPERLQSREIGFIPFFGSMIRHRKVNSTKEMDSFVVNSIPRHLYYSSAYYRKPDEKKMQEKEWLGAELIFDLDADHIQAEKKLTYEQTLGLIKEHTIRLIDGFLLKEMGFEEKDLKLFFSGGRGYHVHVLSHRVYSMTSDSRREIASYIRGEGLSLDEIMRVYRYVPLNRGGWVQRFAEMLMASPTEKNVRAGISPEGEISNLKASGVRRTNAVSKEFAEMIRTNMSEIDEPVTTDTHRLIRYPGSLHGKTGFMVKGLTIDDLPDFEPLEQCIPDVFREGYEEVNFLEPMNVRLLGETFRFSRGKSRLPLFAALYAVLSGRGQFINNIG